MKCKDTSKFIIDKLAGELSPRQADKLDKHLTACAACRNEFEAFNGAWKFANKTLKKDTFVKKLSPARRSEIFGIAQNEEKRQKSSRRLTRFVEYLAVIAIFFILAGMLLPSLNRARMSGVTNTLGGAVELKTPKLEKMQKIMDEVTESDDEEEGYEDEGNERTVIAQSYWKITPPKKSRRRRSTELFSPSVAPSTKMPTRTITVHRNMPVKKTAWTNDIQAPRAASGNRTLSKLVTDTKLATAPGQKVYKQRVFKQLEKRERNESEIMITKDMMDSVAVSEKRAKKKKEIPKAVSSYSYELSSSDKAKGRQQARHRKTKKLKIQKRLEMKSNANVARMTSSRGEDRSLKNYTQVLDRKKINYKADVSRSNSGPARLAGSSSRSRSIYTTPVTQKIFVVNLKLWNMTTVSNVRKYLKDHNCSVSGNIKVHKKADIIVIYATKKMLKKIEKLFKKLQQEEKNLKDLRKGLPFIKCSSRPISTFSIDTDTASYVQARKSIMRGERPNPLKIRPEEFINYFDYNYRSPHNATFAVYPEAAPSPFRPNNTLFRIGIQGKRLGPKANTSTHYTILLDTSGSMAVKDRMELAKKALAMLFKKLKSSDYVSLLLCGSRTRVVFKIKALTHGNRQRLLNTLNNISPRGVADFAKGISKAYSFAGRHYILNGSSRIIIISDGIFELDTAGRQNITAQIEAARKRGISNIVIGLGGDGDDSMLEKVAAIGDGSYVFLDTEREAKELFTTQFEARFREIARDVKIQVEFNPDAVKSYRQIGYKNRQLSKADFRNDKVDAGEVGSGQAVTALYELKLKDNIPDDAIVVTVRIRYKKAGDMSVEEKTFYLSESDIKDKFKTASANFKLAAFVSEFAESLRYPETQGIASLRGVADQLNSTWMKHYRKDHKVTELLSLIKRSK